MPQFDLRQQIRAQLLRQKKRPGADSTALNENEFVAPARELFPHELLELACNRLAQLRPEMSASKRFSSGQIVVFLGLGVICAVALLEAPAATTYYISVCFTLLFTSVICLRSIALSPNAMPRRSEFAAVLSDHDLPVYSILVPLFREANMIESLVNALMSLDYPRELLDIKLILEADDRETIEAVSGQNLPKCFDVVLVPPHPLRTKPKALNYALPLARGEFVVVFDAEDRPDPKQLKMALYKFRNGPQKLACLQASLAYYNAHENWLTKQFAIEYAGLFDAFLPALAWFEMPIPLGGTSNHFKVDKLREVGCWDAYNVTEDADLGIRLARHGFTIDVLASVTYEEAVPSFGAWIRQRSRCIKGWLQTWLVHTRRPASIVSELGMTKALVVQTLLLGIIVTSVGYPVFLGVTLYKLLYGAFALQPYFWIDMVVGPLQLWVLFFGFAVNIAIGYVAIQRRELMELKWQILFIPIYWMLISLASWHAVIQFILDPFYWEKTTHGQSRKS